MTPDEIAKLPESVRIALDTAQSNGDGVEISDHAIQLAVKVDAGEITTEEAVKLIHERIVSEREISA